MFSSRPPTIRPGKRLCSFCLNEDIPCARRVDYILIIGNGRSRACYTHMMGLIWNYQWAKLDLPAFYATVVN